MSSNRRTTVSAILLILLFFGAGVYLSARLLVDDDLPLLGGSRVAVLPVEGVIVSEKELVRELERFRRSDAVRAFVVEIRSPGGTVGASQSIYRALRELREADDRDRPVIAWIGDVGASGGYYVALAADSIYALPGSITGSIGVIMEFPNAGELMRKIGVEVEVVKSGEHKDLGSLVRPLSEGDREILEGVVRDVWGQFVDAVAENRRLDRERAERLADGRIFTGEQAAELGLVDRIGTLEDAIEAAGRMAGLGERPETVRPRERERSLLDLVTDAGAGRLRRALGWLAEGTGGSTPRLLYEWR